MVDAIAEAEGISMSCVSNKAIFGKGSLGVMILMQMLWIYMQMFGIIYVCYGFLFKCYDFKEIQGSELRTPTNRVFIVALPERMA